MKFTADSFLIKTLAKIFKMTRPPKVNKKEAQSG